jgi:hypothetical protein
MMLTTGAGVLAKVNRDNDGVNRSYAVSSWRIQDIC